MVSTLIAPTNAVDFNNFDDIANLICDVYYSLGEMDPTSDVPTSKATLEALYTGATPKFKPLGELDEDPFDVGWKQESENVHRGTLAGRPKFEGQIKSIAFCPQMLTMIDSAELKGVLSLLLVPRNQPATFTVNTPGLFWAYSGVKLTHEGKPNISGKKNSIIFSITANPNNVKDCLKLDWLTS